LTILPPCLTSIANHRNRYKSPLCSSNLTLEEALRLGSCSCTRRRIRSGTERAALRWLDRYLTEGKEVTLLSAHLALSALAELRAGDSAQAARLLTELATRD